MSASKLIQEPINRLLSDLFVESGKRHLFADNEKRWTVNFELW